MLHYLFQWFIVINIFVFLWSRKTFFKLWKGVFSLKGLGKIPLKIIDGVFRITFKILKRILWAIPRLLYWFGWIIVEFFKFLIYSFRALFSLMKF